MHGRRQLMTAQKVRPSAAWRVCACIIDRSFVVGLDQGQQGAPLLRAIVELGHSLGMAVVAEGVETASQASTVQLLGCDFIQGYFTGRPASIDAIEMQLRTAGAAPRKVARQR